MASDGTRLYQILPLVLLCLVASPESPRGTFTPPSPPVEDSSCHEIWSLTQQDNSDLSRIEALCDQCLSTFLAPNQRAYVLTIRGKAVREQGRYEHALQDFNEAIDLAPNYALAHFHQAFTLAHFGHLEGAIQSYSRAIELAPDMSEAYRNRSFLYFHFNRMEEGLADLNKHIELEPSAEMYQLRGRILMEIMDRPEEAEADARKALELDPDIDVSSILNPEANATAP